MSAQRKILTTLIERIELGRPSRKLSKWATDEDRAEVAAERTTVIWKQP